MEKILILILGLVYAFWHFSVQNIEVTQNKSASHTQKSENSESSNSTEIKALSQSDVYKVIKKVGEESGWIMTDFKSNAIIAEKISESGTVAVTVNFTSSSFDISPSNSDLRSSLNKALNI